MENTPQEKPRMPVTGSEPASPLGFEAFHEMSRKLDFVGPLESLLEEFRRGNIADKHRMQEASAIRSHLAKLTQAWDCVFPAFPDCPWKRRTINWEKHRGHRDAYLERLVVTFVPRQKVETRLIVNPATVAGMHARRLAHRLPDYEVVGTDIDARWNSLYRYVLFWKYRHLNNYRFVRDSIFEPNLDRRPAVVVFFGACGSVTDACMDYAVAVNSPLRPRCARSIPASGATAATQASWATAAALSSATSGSKNCPIQKPLMNDSTIDAFASKRFHGYVPHGSTGTRPNGTRLGRRRQSRLSPEDDGDSVANHPPCSVSNTHFRS